MNLNKWTLAAGHVHLFHIVATKTLGLEEKNNSPRIYSFPLIRTLRLGVFAGDNPISFSRSLHCYTWLRLPENHLTQRRSQSCSSGQSRQRVTFLL